MSKLVSILMPAYNAEKWMADAIGSAIGQTWSHKELIIVDDGSRDQTLAIARSFESRFVKVLAQDNMGASAARNKALGVAQGDYIQWLDADDLLDPDKIAAQMRVGSDSRWTTLFSSAFGTFYSRWRKARFAPNELWQDLEPVEWLVARFSDNLWFVPAVWLVSRRLAEKAGPWREDLSVDDDGEYFCRLVSQSDGVKFVGEARSYYRQSGYAQLSRQETDKALESLTLSVTLSVGHLRSLEQSDRTRRATAAVLQRLYAYLYYCTDAMEIAERVRAMAPALCGGVPFSNGGNWKWDLLAGWCGRRTAKSVITVWRRLKVMVRVYGDMLLHAMSWGQDGIPARQQRTDSWWDVGER